MEYLYFIGASLLLMTSVICFLLQKEEDPVLPWGFLGVSSFFLFVKRLAGMGYAMYGREGFLPYAEFAALAAALVLIAEAGRRARGVSWAWFYIPLLLVCAFSVPYGVAGMDAACRLTFGLAGAVLVSAHLIKARGERRDSVCAGRAIAMMAAGVPSYALFSAMTPPPSGFLSAAFLNSETVRGIIGFGVGPVSLFFLAIMGAGIWLYFFTYDAGCGITQSRKGRAGLAAMGVFSLLFAGGWYFTENLSRHAVQHLADDVSMHADMIAGSLAQDKLGEASSFTSSYLQLSHFFNSAGDDVRVFLVDRHGVIFGSDERRYFMRAMWPGDRPEGTVPSSAGTVQLSTSAPLLSAEPSDGDMVSVGGALFMSGRSAVGRGGWTVVVFHDLGTVLMAKFMGMSATAVMLLFASLAFSAYVLSESAREKAEETLRLREEVSALEGIIPICASCKKIRDDKGYWNQVENYISRHAGAEFSHALCPSCARKLYPKYYKENDSKGDNK